MAKHFYAIHTFSGQEDKVKANIELRAPTEGLADKIARTLVPKEEEHRMRGDRRVTVSRKIFPGYVMVEMEMDDDTWQFIRHIPGVTGFVGQVDGATGRPAPLQPTEVEMLLATAGEAAPQRRTALFHKGERVNVTSGPFSGNEGTIEDIHVKTEKLTVMIPIFGRETKVDLDFSHVERIS